MSKFPPLRVGLASIARTRFDYKKAGELYQASIAALKQFEGIDLVAPDDMILDNPDSPAPGLAERAVSFFRRAEVDALIFQSGTFTMGDIPLDIIDAMHVPVILWGLPEPDWTSGRLRLNSLVGLNLNASHLYKMRRPFRYLVAAPGDPMFQEEMGRFLRVLRVVQGLRKTKVVMLGTRSQGFFDLSYNEMDLRAKLGVEVITVALNEVFDLAESLPAAQVKETEGQIRALYDDMSEVSPQQEEKQARAYLAMRQVAHKHKAATIGIRCWPEFPFNYGVAACSSIALLNGEGIPGGCEGDLEGGLTSLILQELSGSIPYLSDVSSVDFDQNSLLLWHNGCAALTLAATRKSLFTHFQVNHGLTNGFGLKPGRVTLARLGNDGREMRLLAAPGQALPTEMVVRGTMSNVRTDAPVKKVLDTLMYGGWEHHLSMAYADLVGDLRELATLTGIPLTEVE